MTCEEVWIRAEALFLQAPRIIEGLVWFAIFLCLGILGNGICRLAGQRFAEVQRPVFRLLGRVLQGGMVVVGLVMALDNAGIDVSALVAGLGLTGFALGFAMKDALSNLIAGSLILLYRPYRIGTRITIGAVDGIVTDMDLRYTRIRGEGKEYLLPNSVVFGSTIVLHEAMPQERPAPDGTDAQ